MKWTQENIDKMKLLSSQGKTFELIAKELKTTNSSVRNKFYKLGLKQHLNYHENLSCLFCNKPFKSYKKENRKFCSSSCSAHFNNKDRKYKKHSIPCAICKLPVKTTINISKVYCKDCRRDVDNERSKKYRKKKVCKFCKNNISESKKLVCSSCRLDYYSVYRPSCRFDFDISEYADKFNLDLVEKHGWYSPSNKGNNLYGVTKDHMYSVKDGFVNKICPSIIKHPANCKLMLFSNNSKKNDKSSITLEELMDRIKSW